MKTLLNWMTAVSCVFGLFSFASWGDASSSLSPLPAFSPCTIPLEWSAAEPLESATYTIFYRRGGAGEWSGWQSAASLQAVSATQGVFEAEQGGSYEFRSAVFSPKESEMAILADFDFYDSDDGYFLASERNSIHPACSAGGFNRTFHIQTDSVIQGNGCYNFTFHSNLKDLSSVPPGALIGLRFGKGIPEKDWSSFRFLELYYWGDVPGGVDLWIESSKVGIRQPLHRFSEDGNELNQWHSILVDLDRVMGDPEARREIRTLAFVKRIHNLDWTKKYEIRLDAIRLWRTRNFVRTSIDDTPPAAPQNVRYERKPNAIEWTWDPSQEDHSNIAGYSFLFTQDRRKKLPPTILSATNFVSIPFKKTSFYQEFFFMVSACNEAGLWSPITQSGFTSKP
ncbi:MAG: hypothetical protein JXR73_03665 [Candidatus Omnitrophica bacterium]|nr:hypothetical protein [Candidatus Omnitrophota bacterium]